jgi:putative FmdB family regulatory protein
MPIYEYRCLKCGQKSTFVTLSVKAALEPACRKCGCRDVVKLVSRVSISRSEESRMESLADPSKLAGVDENDPKSLARWMKRMGKEMGDEMGEDLDESIDEAMEQSDGPGADGDEGEGGMGGGTGEDF